MRLLLLSASLLLVSSLLAAPAQAGCPPTGCISPPPVPCLFETDGVACLREEACGSTVLNLLPVHPCDGVFLPPCPPSTNGVVAGPVEACVGHGACPPGYVGHRAWLSIVSTTLGIACARASGCDWPEAGARVEVLGGPSVGDCVSRQPLPVVVDRDVDGVQDDVDNCPFVQNQDQADTDDDGLGDKCDPDIDGDNAPNGTDPDTDGDGWPNDTPAGGDPDDDNDGDPDAPNPDPDPTPTGPTTPFG